MTLRNATHTSLTTIESQAPGKLVLSGEYITLLGAPSLILAIDQYAQASITVQKQGGWVVSSNIVQTVSFPSLYNLCSAPPTDLVPCLVQALSDPSKLPDHAAIRLDSRSFYQNNTKLGIGSSAAVLVACARCIEKLANHRFSLDELISLHNSLQGGKGSGLDVATASLGGLVRFQNGKAIRATPPAELHMSFVFTGSSTSTYSMVDRFHKLVASYPESKITQWHQLAVETSEAIGHAAKFLDALSRLSMFVREFDNETRLGIYSDAHNRAADIADCTGILYKPSGAGGGDMGIALSTNRQKLTDFNRQAEQAGLTLMDFGISNHGASIFV